MFQLNFPQNKNKTHTHKKEKQLSKFAQKLKRKRKRTIMIIVMFDKALPKKTMMSEEREREREGIRSGFCSSRSETKQSVHYPLLWLFLSFAIYLGYDINIT